MTQTLKPLPVDVSDVCIALEAGEPGYAWYLDLETGGTLLVGPEYDPAENGGLTSEEIDSDRSRFAPVPPRDPQAGYQDMVLFTAQLTDDRLRESLELALGAPRPFRRFKAVLGWLPEEQRAWHEFKQKRLEADARAFLEECGVVPAGIPRR
jgi:Uncharacterised protein family (UPF0158)